MTTITAVQRMFPEVPEAHANPAAEKRLVTGFDVGPFFVHIGLSDDETLSYSNDRHEWDTWHVTHRSSGFAVQKKINTHPRAIWLAQQLCALDVWDHDTKPALLAGLSQEQLGIIATLRADAMSGDCQGQLGMALVSGDGSGKTLPALDASTERVADGVSRVQVLDGEHMVLVPVRLQSIKVSEFKDMIGAEYGMHSIYARPFWARLLSIVAGLSDEEQEVINAAEVAAAHGRKPS